MPPVADTLAALRAEADTVEPYAPPAAHALRKACAAIEAALAAESADGVDLRTAARISGYRPDYLSRLIAAGKLPNVGRKHAPRVRPADLPRKADAPPAAEPPREPPPVDLALLRRAQRARGR